MGYFKGAKVVEGGKKLLGTGTRCSLLAKTWSSPQTSGELPKSKVTPEVLEKLRHKVLQASFMMADRDRDDQLLKAEFTLMIRRAYFGIEQSAVDKAYIDACGDGYGVVTFTNFVAWLSRRQQEVGKIADLPGCCNQAAEENIVPTKAVWRLWNMDGDEKLSNAEFEYCMKKAFPDIKDKKLLQILQTMDEDLSGEVAEDEFVHFLVPPAKADPRATISQQALGG
ncbi:CAL [Symbiodinium sp. CCMP2592]|nr:CAL [Symbiodinium sp. CCMP2592]